MNEHTQWRGLGTLVTHYGEGENPHHAHITPIFQTSTFSYPDVATARAIYTGEMHAYSYTRTTNPNPEQYVKKVALLESLDLLREKPESSLDDLVAGRAFGSGMAAISAAILARVKAGDTILSQASLYSNAYNFLQSVAPRLGINVIWVRDTSSKGWEAAFRDTPQASMVYLETPANPTMLVVDIKMVVDLAHQFGAWVMIDNTFATPYCQRPLSLGADVVLHSTTKYLSGHGVIIGGAVVSPHRDYVEEEVHLVLKTMGGAPSPIDSWLANLGLKTFELRMKRHCENAMNAARYLQSHPKVAKVYYPGLENDPGHEIARKQMFDFGGMLSFELKGGQTAAEELIDHLRLPTLTASLGNVDSLIQHPASMTHVSVPPPERLKMGISDGLVRYSVGIENSEDILADLEQGLG
ncbi:MAG: PLP-dependent transferase [Anaerolineales bacterium]|nr:PLP-dependent transferase [Anaerolineales bacterium]